MFRQASERKLKWPLIEIRIAARDGIVKIQTSQKKDSAQFLFSETYLEYIFILPFEHKVKILVLKS